MNNWQKSDISLSVFIFSSVPSCIKELPLECSVIGGHATDTGCWRSTQKLRKSKVFGKDSIAFWPKSPIFLVLLSTCAVFHPLILLFFITDLCSKNVLSSLASLSGKIVNQGSRYRINFIPFRDSGPVVGFSGEKESNRTKKHYFCNVALSLDFTND